MLKIAEASLIFCVTAAVLAFGGTEPISFAVVEIVLLGAVLAVLIGVKILDGRVLCEVQRCPRL